jgi:putative oxidoreductase
MANEVTMADPITTREDAGKLLLRIAVGGLLLFHGVSKLMGGIGWMAGMLASNHLPAFIGYGVYVGEVIAPIFLLLGVFTRAAALIVAFDLLMAILLVQRTKIFTLNQGGGWTIELEMLFLLGGLAIFLLGSGRYALRRGKGRWD